jgi:glucan phosphorylase
MDYETLTIGFARRATAYKRHSPDIFSDIERLKKRKQAGEEYR